MVQPGLGSGSGGCCKDPPPVHSRLFVYWVGYIRPAEVRASERRVLSALAVIQRDPKILRTGGGNAKSPQEPTRFLRAEQDRSTDCNKGLALLELLPQTWPSLLFPLVS